MHVGAATAAAAAIKQQTGEHQMIEYKTKLQNGRQNHAENIPAGLRVEGQVSLKAPGAPARNEPPPPQVPPEAENPPGMNKCSRGDTSEATDTGESGRCC